MHFIDFLIALNDIFSKCVPLLCLTEAEVRALAKERQKKDNHNLSESILHQILMTG